MPPAPPAVSADTTIIHAPPRKPYAAARQWAVPEDGVRPFALPLHRARAELLNLTGSWDRAEATYRCIANWAAQTGDGRLEGDTANSLGVLLFKQGRRQEAMTLLEENRSRCQRIGYAGGLASAIGNLGNVYRHEGDYNRAIKCYQLQASMSRQAGDDRGVASATNNQGNIHWQLSEIEPAMRCYREMLRIARECGDHGLEGIATGNIGNVLCHLGEYHQALEHYRQQLSIGERLGDAMQAGIAIGNMGYVHSCQGDDRTAMECYQAKMVISRRLGDKQSLAIVGGNMGEVHARQGDLRQAEERYDLAIGLGRELGARYYLCSFLYFKAALLWRNGRHGPAGELNAEALEMARAVRRQDIIFKCRLMEAELTGVDDRLAAMRTLAALLGEYRDDARQADILYELYQQGRDPANARRAAGLYRTAYARHPAPEVWKRIEELESAERPAGSDSASVEG